MLSFAQHNIFAKTEERPMTTDGAKEAFAKVTANTARYRMVLVNRGNLTATPSI
jgi:D-arabinose 1-dehydrogenase-like Zn-dependent alcohol dehydrogenase